MTMSSSSKNVNEKSGKFFDERSTSVD